MLGFLIGFSVPFMARKLIKIFPEEAGTTLAYMIKPRMFGNYKPSEHRKKWAGLFFKLLCLGIFYGIVTVGLNIAFDASSWLLAFVWMLLMLLEVDRRSMLLPDVLTVPLIITGFTYACSNPELSPLASAMGAMFGYFMPTLTSCVVTFFKKNTIGGGDIKILAGLGAWLGMYHLAFAIVLSCLIFIVIAIVKRERAGPYGPAIVIASLVAMYLKYNNLFMNFIY